MNSIIGRLAVWIAALCIFTTPFPVHAATSADSVSEQKSPPSSIMKSVIVGVLFLASVISIFLIIERALTLRQESVIPAGLAQAQSTCANANDLMSLRTACNAQPSPFGRLLACCIDHLNLPREDNMEVLQTRARAEVVKMERGIVVLEIITGVGPLLGLVGTIFGLITLFKGMGVEVASDQEAMFSEGISLALEATLLGLAVAIPSLIGWSYFNRRIEAMVVEMENHCDEFLRYQYQRVE